MTAKMLTSPDGNFGFSDVPATCVSTKQLRVSVSPPFDHAQGVPSYVDGPSSHPQVRFERHQRILTPQLDDPIVIPRLRNDAGHERVTQPPKLVPIQVVDEIVDELGRRLSGGAYAVKEELVEHVRSIPMAGHGRVPGRPGGVAHCGCVR